MTDDAAESSDVNHSILPRQAYRQPHAQKENTSGPGSRHLYSQTSGPRRRSLRGMLPFCMDSSSDFILARIMGHSVLLRAQSRHKSWCHTATGSRLNQGFCGGLTAFLRRNDA